MDSSQLQLRSLCKFLPARADRRAECVESHWTPEVGVVEDERQLVIRAQLPGTRAGDIHVIYSRGMVVIVGERQLQTAPQPDDTGEQPASFESFVHRVPLGNNVTASDVRAEFQEGILRVRVRKKGRGARMHAKRKSA